MKVVNLWKYKDLLLGTGVLQQSSVRYISSRAIFPLQTLRGFHCVKKKKNGEDRKFQFATVNGKHKIKNKIIVVWRFLEDAVNSNEHYEHVHWYTNVWQSNLKKFFGLQTDLQ